MPSLRVLSVAPIVLALVLDLILGLVGARAEAATGLRVVGDAKFRVVAERRIASSLASRGHQITDKALGQGTMAALDECYLRNEPQCANKVFVDNSDADLFLYVNFEISGGVSRDRTVRGTLWLLRKVGGAKTYAKQCTSCEDDAAMSMVDDLVNEVGSFDDRAGGIKLVSQPAGATVTLDGERVGITPLERELRPGSYQLVVSRPGYADDRRTIAIAPSRVVEQVVELRPLPTRDPRRRRKVAYGAAGVAVALAIGGGVLLALNEGSSCERTKQQCFYATPGAIAALAGAGVFLGAAGYFWFTADRGAASPVAGAPTSRPKAWVAGWGASF